MPKPDHLTRLRKNADSLAAAEHHREPWSELECEVLMLWDGSEEELAELAELLGRTIEACRERYYKHRKGRSKTVTVKHTDSKGKTSTTTTTTTYIGWLESDGDGW